MRIIAYIVVGLFCAGVLFLLLRTFVFRDSWRHNKKIDLKELRRIDIEYGQKQDRDDRFKRGASPLASCRMCEELNRAALIQNRARNSTDEGGNGTEEG